MKASNEPKKIKCLLESGSRQQGTYAPKFRIVVVVVDLFNLIAYSIHYHTNRQNITRKASECRKGNNEQVVGRITYFPFYKGTPKNFHNNQKLTQDYCRINTAVHADPF